MTDKEKAMIALIILIIGSVVSYRVELIDKVLFKHSGQIEELQKDSKTNKEEK